MRITQKMMIDMSRTNLLRQNEQLFHAQNQVSSGKRMTRPSDDPIGMGNSLDYRSILTGIDQHIDTIKMGRTRLEMTDQTLTVISDFLKSAGTFSRKASAPDATGRAIASEEVANARQQILQLANTRLDDSYLLGGHRTDIPPVSEGGEIQLRQGRPSRLAFGLEASASAIDIEIRDASGTLVRTLSAAGGPGILNETWDGLNQSGDPLPDGAYRFSAAAEDGPGRPVDVKTYATYNGDDGDHMAQVAKGQTIKVNANGREVFSTTNGVVDILRVLQDLETELQKPEGGFNSVKVKALVVEIDRAMNRIEQVRGRGASRLHRLDATLTFQEGLRPKMEQMLADVEDVDLTRAIVQLRAQEVAYQAALELTSRVFEPTLMDFLR